MVEVLRIRFSLLQRLEREAVERGLSASQLLCEMIARAEARKLKPENRNKPHRKMIGFVIDEQTENKLAILAKRFNSPKASVCETIIGAAK